MHCWFRDFDWQLWYVLRVFNIFMALLGYFERYFYRIVILFDSGRSRTYLELSISRTKYQVGWNGRKTPPYEESGYLQQCFGKKFNWWDRIIVHSNNLLLLFKVKFEFSCKVLICILNLIVQVDLNGSLSSFQLGFLR